ncbi:Cna B-type domain-containing protein [Peptostreptococcus porci]|uniref:Cna B-type domain-containing protein n=1 Tax=Peptostreptococcus porci TaxID=2652282 RepID=UPI002A75B77A|nr:Cna B-type domain-containing protein [Peptostreptococcus porci]MDY2794216.1 Cna B-type domain-containing protein [Peptostreptococcus porci]
MKKKRWFGALLSLLMVLSTLFSGTSTMVFAEGTPQTVDATITDFRIEKPKGTEVDHLSKNDSFYLAMDWKVRDENAILHEGDYFDITLPDNMRFPPAYSQPDFDLTDSDGNVIATAHVTHGTENQAGGTIRVTFKDGINDNYNVHGTIYLGALFNKEKTVDNEVNTFEVSVNGETKSTQLTVDKIGLPSDHVLGKWGERVTEGGQITNKVKWYATINYRKSDMKNCIISDSLSGDTTYLQDTFRLRKVVYNDEGVVVSYGDDVDLTGKLSFAGDNKSFTINLGDAGTDQYRLTYETTYTPGTEIRNNLRLQFDGEDKTTSSKFQSSQAGGTAGGDLANKIKITKVDADDNSIVLKDAVFTVTKPDGSTFELTTGNDGTVTSGSLTSGTYKVKEKTPPSGYKLNEEGYTLQVTSSGGALQTIKDEPIKTSVKVNKKWIGKEGTSVIVHLYADGEDTGKTVTLNGENSWSETFEGLRQYTSEGTEIKYTVKEDEQANYSSETTGSMKDGYTITNTNVEKISIPVTKTWVGKKADSVTVKLLADNNDTGKTLTLNEAEQWKGSFTDLLKYDGKDGHEIAYTIEEVKIDGYNSVIPNSGGFVTDEKYIIFVLSKPQSLNIKTGDNRGKRSGLVKMIRLSASNGNVNYNESGKNIKISIDTDDTYWPSDTSLPLGEPGTSSAKILDGSTNSQAVIKVEPANEELAKKVKNTNQTVKAKNTNMREKPSKNSAIVRTLLSGTTVYVIDTYIESPERMWCKINYDGATGWISYNTINGSIK